MKTGRGRWLGTRQKNGDPQVPVQIGVVTDHPFAGALDAFRSVVTDVQAKDVAVDLDQDIVRIVGQRIENRRTLCLKELRLVVRARAERRYRVAPVPTLEVGEQKFAEEGLDDCALCGVVRLPHRDAEHVILYECDALELHLR